jgi:hypothetical protein
MPTIVTAANSYSFIQEHLIFMYETQAAERFALRRVTVA